MLAASSHSIRLDTRLAIASSFGGSPSVDCRSVIRFESHKDRINASKGEYILANLVPEFVGHRTHVEFTQESDSSVGRCDTHALRVDAEKDLADLVETCRTNCHYWNRVIQ